MNSPPCTAFSSGSEFDPPPFQYLPDSDNCSIWLRVRPTKLLIMQPPPQSKISGQNITLRTPFSNKLKFIKCIISVWKENISAPFWLTDESFKPCTWQVHSSTNWHAANCYLIFRNHDKRQAISMPVPSLHRIYISSFITFNTNLCYRFPMREFHFLVFLSVLHNFCLSLSLPPQLSISYSWRWRQQGKATSRRRGAAVSHCYQMAQDTVPTLKEGDIKMYFLTASIRTLLA